MNLKKLDYFVTLVDAGNFSHAAEQLYITQPALSWNIKDLESSLKTELLVRSASGIELTETGSILYDGAKSLLEKAAQLERSIAIAQHHSKRKVRLGMTILSSIEYMDIFQYFASQYEEYQLDFVQRGSKEIQDMLAKGQLDIGIVSEPIYYPSLENTRRKLDDYYYEVAVVVSKDNPLSTEKSITFDMVKEEKLA